MKGWRTARLGDVCSKITDGTHHSPSNGPIGDFKYITAKNIKPYGLDLNDLTYIDAATHAEIYSRCDVRRDDILYVKDGATTGRVALNTFDEPFSLLSSVAVLRPGTSIRPRYLLYVLQERTVKDRMLADVAGVAITRLTLKKLNNATIPLAPIDLQDELVAEIEKQFSRLDEAVANLQRVKANLKRYRGAVISDAVGGRMDFDDAPSLNTWQCSSLASVTAKITSGSRDWSPYYGKGEAIFVLAQNVRPFSPDFSTIQHVDPPPNDPARARSRVQRGDLLVTIVGANTGQACMVESLPAEAFVCQSVALIRPTFPEAAPYLNLWMNSPDHGQEYFAKCMYGQGRPHLGFEQLTAASIALPPLAEQHRIVAEVDRRLSIVREVEAEVDTNLKRAQALRQAVLAKAFGASAAQTPPAAT